MARSIDFGVSLLNNGRSVNRIGNRGLDLILGRGADRGADRGAARAAARAANRGWSRGVSRDAAFGVAFGVPLFDRGRGVNRSFDRGTYF